MRSLEYDLTGKLSKDNNRTTVATMRVSSITRSVDPKPPESHKVVEEKDDKSLHRTLRYILLIGQILGQMPVIGIFGPTPKSLEFKWRTWRVVYCMIPCIMTIFVGCMLIFKMVKSGTDLFVISSFIFHFCRISTTMAFFYLAKRWPNLMKEWSKVEIHMKDYGYLQNFRLRAYIIVGVMLTATTAQYFINQATIVMKSETCKPSNQTNPQYFYTKMGYPYVFNILSYSIWLALPLQILEFSSHLNGCFIDLFIMVMSSALAMRFKQITEKLKNTSETKCDGENVWKMLREDYNRLCRLCKLLDDCMSYIMLISFGSNLFFILIQLFNSLRQLSNHLDKIHFFCSFSLLILRTVFVSLYAAWVNDESKRPASILNSVPSSVYNLEIRRFIQQISFDAVALTGRNFFYVTRGLILSVAGAIVTYELVLIQFNENLLKVNNDEDGCIINN